MKNHPAKRQVKTESAAVRRILLAWDPLGIGGTPEDEYDCLVDRIVSAAHRGSTEPRDIATLISSELTQHFGLVASKDGVLKVAEQVAALFRGVRS